MKGDFTRDTFKAGNHYQQILMQQGRVQVDADWNEQIAIAEHRDETAARDIIGRCGGPEENAAFKCTIENGEISFSAGRYYVDGIMCEVELPFTFYNQPDRIESEIEKLSSGEYRLYLDVWQRHLTQLDDPQIRETALDIPDTTTRVKTVWQVRAEPSIVATIMVPDPNLTASTKTPQSQNPCKVPAIGGYKGSENHLYRVEIHNAGRAYLKDSFGKEKSQCASWKWSRENGTISAAILDINNNEITIDSIGNNATIGFHAGAFAEIIDDRWDLEGKPGDLIKIIEVKEGTIILESDATLIFNKQFHPKVRQWDGYVPQLRANQEVDLENGIIIKFNETTPSSYSQSEPRTYYRCGDYWQIPARAGKADIEWPRNNLNEYIGQPPLGIHHHKCTLVYINVNEKGITLSKDLRNIFPPLTALCKQQNTLVAVKKKCCWSVGNGGDFETLNNAYVNLKTDQILNVCLLPGVHVVNNVTLNELKQVRIIGSGPEACIIEIDETFEIIADSIILRDLTIRPGDTVPVTKDEDVRIISSSGLKKIKFFDNLSLIIKENTPFAGLAKVNLKGKSINVSSCMFDRSRVNSNNLFTLVEPIDSSPDLIELNWTNNRHVLDIDGIAFAISSLRIGGVIRDNIINGGLRLGSIQLELHEMSTNVTKGTQDSINLPNIIPLANLIIQGNTIKSCQSGCDSDLVNKRINVFKYLRIVDNNFSGSSNFFTADKISLSGNIFDTPDIKDKVAVVLSNQSIIVGNQSSGYQFIDVYSHNFEKAANLLTVSDIFHSQQ
jgi:hypothetical protein